jgi:hypothetical protein
VPADCRAEIAFDGATAAARCENLSDGGALLRLALEAPADRALQVRLSLHRRTPNTRMVEQVSSPARVVRRTPDGKLAVQFAQPLRLLLEV